MRLTRPGVGVAEPVVQGVEVAVGGRDRGTVAPDMGELPLLCSWLRALSATAFVDEFQQQLTIHLSGNIHEK
ncbi:hypothetical protein [Streptomyces sp. NPDC002851]